MELKSVILSLFVATLLVLGHVAADDGERKAYIVYMGEASKSKTLTVEDHHSLLSDVTQDEELIGKNLLIHSYGKALNGFAAYLTPDEAARLKENENVVSVFPNGVTQLQTSRSWDFIGMPLQLL